LFQVTSEFGPNPYRGFAVVFRGCTDYKAIPWANFQNFGRIFSFLKAYSYLHDVLTGLPSMTNRQIKNIVPKAWAAAKSNAALRAA
jgi:hypothetical protein